MPNKSKNKGKVFERDVCKHLSSVFGLNFERIPNSGAFIGGQNFSRSQRLTPEQLLLTDGDIIVPKELSFTKFECKWHADLSFKNFFTECKKLDSWIKQAESGNRLFWCLIFRVNNAGEYIVFDSKWYLNFNFVHSWMIYKKSYIITPMKGFFEANKDRLLNLPANDNTDILG